MLNIQIVTAAGEKSKGAYLLGSPMDSVRVSFGESFDTSAQKLLLSKKISVIPTFGRNNRESVSSACDSMPALQNTLSFDFNEGECALPGRSDSSGLPPISKSIPLSDGSDGHINHAQRLGIAYLSRVSVTNVGAASAKHVDSGGAKQESSSSCNKSVNVTTGSSI